MSDMTYNFGLVCLPPGHVLCGHINCVTKLHQIKVHLIISQQGLGNFCRSWAFFCNIKSIKRYALVHMWSMWSMWSCTNLLHDRPAFIIALNTLTDPFYFRYLGFLCNYLLTKIIWKITLAFFLPKIWFGFVWPLLMHMVC